jgi:hypothetical protein
MTRSWNIRYAGGKPVYATPEQMAQALRNAGFSEEMIPTMVAIGMAESGGALNVYNDYGAWHHGPWQISGIHTGREQQENPQLYDLQANANMAKKIYDQQGLGAWEAYTVGTHQQFLPGGGRGMVNQNSAPTLDQMYAPTTPTTGGGGSDPLMQRIQAIIQMITDPKADPVAAAQAAQALDGLVAVWKLQNPYTPIDVAIKQAEMQRQYEQRQDQRTDSMYNAALGEFTAKGNAQQQNFQNELGLSDRRDQREYDIFGAQRQYGVDQQQLADAEFANRLLHFNALAGNSDRELNNAQAQVSRSLQGKNVGTQRANQIDQTTMQAAALAPPGGAEYVPGMEPGGLVATALRNIGATVPHDAFRFPDATRGQGFVNINPAQTLLDQDAALGVSGPIPEIPGFSPIAPPTPPNYGEMGITAQNPADLIAGIRGNAPPTPPNLDMSGYPQHPGYGPMTGPPSLAGLMGGGFNVNKPESTPPPPPSTPYSAPLNGSPPWYQRGTRDTPHTEQVGMGGFNPNVAPPRPPTPPQIGDIFGLGSPNLGGMTGGIQMPNLNINPMDLLNWLTPHGVAQQMSGPISSLFGMGR